MSIRLHALLFICVLLVVVLVYTNPARAEVTVRGQVMVLDFTEAGFKDSKKRPYVYWDADSDGRAERCRWVSKGQGLLAIDRDGDGAITDSAELFGSMHMDSFTAVRQIDSEGDMLMTPADKVYYPRLRVWFDDNTDGRSTPDELKTLAEAGVVVLNLKPGVARGKTDAAWYSSFERHTKKRIVWQPLAAVNLHCDESDTRPLTAPAPAPDVLAALPDLAATGNLPSLQTAMARDYAGSRSLFTQVRMLSEMTLPSIFAPERPLSALVDEILFRWAGASESDRTRAGMYIDGRKLVFLARATGYQNYLRDQPLDFWEIYAAELAYNKYHTVMTSQLALQTAAAGIFAGYHKSYDRATGAMRGVTGIEHTGLHTLQSVISRAESAAVRRRSWIVVAEMVDYAIGFSSLSMEDGRRLDAVIQATGEKGGLLDVMNDTLTLLPQEIHAAGVGYQYMEVVDSGKTTIQNLVRSVLRKRGNDEGEIWFHGPANPTMQDCCRFYPGWRLMMRDMGFKVTDVSEEILVDGAPPKQLGYDRVLRAVRNEKDAQVILTSYFLTERLLWVDARVVPTTRK